MLGEAALPSVSAGILLYRRENGLRVLLAHFGGPYWHRKDQGAWSIPKGELAAGEAPEAAARREFLEELGAPAPLVLVSLGDIRQGGGKLVHAFAGEGEFDVACLRSNAFTIEWPPKSGRRQSFPEVDRAQWFDLAEAEEKILASQRALLARLSHLLAQSN
jgi:predicted NUDIX family NTP pyrophosphohydrolase